MRVAPPLPNPVAVMNRPPAADCCPAMTWVRRASLAVGAIVAVVLVAVAAYRYGRHQSPASAMGPLAHQPTVMIDGRPVPLVDASGAVVSEKFSIASGPVSQDGDGFFMLDHNSGLLQCQVIYPRLGRVGAVFQTNVAEALGSGGQGGSYLMLTGRVNFPRSSNTPAASVVIYVMDTATGNYVAYGVPFNESMVNSGRPQNGALVLITRGSANPLVDRDALR